MDSVCGAIPLSLRIHRTLSANLNLNVWLYVKLGQKNIFRYKLAGVYEISEHLFEMKKQFFRPINVPDVSLKIGIKLHDLEVCLHENEITVSSPDLKMQNPAVAKGLVS